MTVPPHHVYRVSADCQGPLRQGEFLTNLGLFKANVETVGTDEVAFLNLMHPYAVILTQDCDLEQDHRVRFPGEEPSDKLIPCVLFCEVSPAHELFGQIKKHGGSSAWNRIKQNNDLRYHFLQTVEPAFDSMQEGLPELAIDFKRFFTLATEEVYRRIEIREAARRCVLNSPYLEHLATRFAQYLSRVALPEPHRSEAS